MSSQNFDVIVIGRGITGLSAARHLAKISGMRIALVGPKPNLSNCSSLKPGFVTATALDNITRIDHGHGRQASEALIKLGNLGFDGLKRFSHEHSIPWLEGDVLRIAPTKHEHAEMKEAHKIFQALGYNARLQAPVSDSAPQGVVCTQHDGLRSATTDSKMLLEQLETSCSSLKIFSEDAKQMQISSNHVNITTTSRDLNAEMVVVAAHLHTGQFVPNLQSALVSFADQWIRFRCEKSAYAFQPGQLIIAHHGHYTAWLGHDGYVYMTGARFLRKWAGIEATTAEVLPQVTEHLLKKAQEWFGCENVSDISAHGILDCRPCDEIPVIGPMYGEQRIFVGVGYMGAGLALGFAAGRCLAEIIHSGKSNQLSPVFLPSRLRSLS